MMKKDIEHVSIEDTEEHDWHPMEVGDCYGDPLNAMAFGPAPMVVDERVVETIAFSARPRFQSFDGGPPKMFDCDYCAHIPVEVLVRTLGAMGFEVTRKQPDSYWEPLPEGMTDEFTDRELAGHPDYKKIDGRWHQRVKGAIPVDPHPGPGEPISGTEHDD